MKSKDSIKKICFYSSDEEFSLLCDRMNKILNNFSPSESSSALDIAAYLEHTTCLVALLNENPLADQVNITTLNNCLDLNSIKAFSFLLSCFNSTIVGIFGYCIKNLNFDAVEVLLQIKPNSIHEIDFSPFHLASIGSLGLNLTQSSKYSNLLELFSLLISSGFDVNEKRFIGQYPLYSMIYSFVHELDNNRRYVPEFHIKSLELLVHAGANPNYDEQESHKNNDCYTERDLYSSALNAFFDCLYSCETWSPRYTEYLDRVCLMLLENGADANHLNLNSESPLHAIMKLAADQHTMGHLSADFFSMTCQFLFFGADPNCLLPNSHIHITPLTYYFKNLFENMGGYISFNRWMKSDVLSQILPIFNYMNRDVANKTIKVISELLDQKVKDEEGLSISMSKKVKENLVEYLGGIRSLQDCCKLSVWHACNRKAMLIKDLELPKCIIEEFNSFFVIKF